MQIIYLKTQKYKPNLFYDLRQDNFSIYKWFNIDIHQLKWLSQLIN